MFDTPNACAKPTFCVCYVAYLWLTLDLVTLYGAKQCCSGEHVFADLVFVLQTDRNECLCLGTKTAKAVNHVVRLAFVFGWHQIGPSPSRISLLQQLAFESPTKRKSCRSRRQLSAPIRTGRGSGPAGGGAAGALPAAARVVNRRRLRTSSPGSAGGWFSAPARAERRAAFFLPNG